MREQLEVILLVATGVLIGGGILLWVNTHVKCWNIFGSQGCIVW